MPYRSLVNFFIEVALLMPFSVAVMALTGHFFDGPSLPDKELAFHSIIAVTSLLGIASYRYLKQYNKKPELDITASG